MSEIKIRGKMKIAVLVLMLVLVVSITGCTEKASELFETAKFEELQSNNEHAIKLYEEIIKKYPDSEYAGKAKERLAEIRKKGDIK